MTSLWRETSELPTFQALDRDIDTDVLIIGGGMAGILCAYMLARAGVPYVLVEAGRIGGGITQDTTAKITSQHGLIYDTLEHSLGLEAARIYLMANESALAKYRALCADIDCGFEERDAFTYSLHDRSRIDRELQALGRIGFPATYAEGLPLPFAVAGAVKFPHQAQFHPLRFIAAIARGLRIFENTRVREMKRMTARTNAGSVTAKKIIVATHFPFINKHGSYFLKLYQHRSYVLALENVPDVEGMYIDGSQTGLSFRSYEGLLLLGGGAHRTGKPGGGWRALREAAARYYPAAREHGCWATQDCMTLDGLPYIGRYSRGTPDLYVATGFNKWGMSSAMVSAMILSDLVCGRDNPYAALFSPSRSILRPQLALNALEAVKHLLTPTGPRCPHLGCALKWNPQERSWDCACHGSRFGENGRLIDNPATGDIRPKEGRLL